MVYCSESFTVAEQKSTSQDEFKTCCYFLLAKNAKTLGSSQTCKCWS